MGISFIYLKNIYIYSIDYVITNNKIVRLSDDLPAYRCMRKYTVREYWCKLFQSQSEVGITFNKNCVTIYFPYLIHQKDALNNFVELYKRFMILKFL